MNFVATGAELRGLVAHEWLEENAAMRLGIELHQKIVKRSDDRIFTGCQLMQLGIFKVKVTLSHGALHVRDGVAHHAAEAGLGLGTMHDLFDWRVHQAAVKHGRIMTTSAPF